MPDRRDDLDSWMDGRIDPLPPPPGTFELIKKRARRRKFHRLAVGAGAAAVIVAAAVAVPQMVNLPVLNSPTATSGQRAFGHAVAVRERRGEHRVVLGRAGALAGSGACPANFRPSSATFIGTQTGWVMARPGRQGTAPRSTAPR